MLSSLHNTSACLGYAAAQRAQLAIETSIVSLDAHLVLLHFLLDREGPRDGERGGHLRGAEKGLCAASFIQ